MSTATRGYGRTGRALARIAAYLAASASFSFAVFADGEAVMQWQGGDELAKWRPYQLSAVTNTAKGVVYDSTGADPVLHSPLFDLASPSVDHVVAVTARISAGGAGELSALSKYWHGSVRNRKFPTVVFDFSNV